ncbi:MAG: redoxin domain-containing protein [Terracidiphilus sp.]
MLRSRFLRCLFPFALLFALTQAQAAPTDFGTDLHGQPIRELTGPGVHVVVLIFAASDCPICNRYVPEIARISGKFAPQGVRFWWVYPNSGDSAAVVEQHNRDFSITGASLLDGRQTLVAFAHATVTPESAVFVVEASGLREVYHGRIDDRYISLGQERPQAQHHDLETAISAALAGKPVLQPGGPPVGCSIVFLQK